MQICSAASGAPAMRRFSPCAEIEREQMVEKAMTGGALFSSQSLIAIGASTGGTEAIRVVIGGLPADAPAVLITQHMPERFTRSFAERLDRLCAVKVKEAEDGERIQPGHVYIAPGHSHLSLARNGASYQAVVQAGPPVNRHRPSVDVLFESVARVAGTRAVGVLLTGMGKDGAQGLLQMRQAGALTLAQDAASCVVYGMPREAAEIGAACEVLDLAAIAPRIMAAVRGVSRFAG